MHGSCISITIAIHTCYLELANTTETGLTKTGRKKKKEISIDFLGQEMFSESLSIDITDVYFTQDPYHFLISIFSSKYHAIVFILLKWYITSIMLPQFKIAKVMVIDITIWFDAKILIKISIN